MQVQLENYKSRCQQFIPNEFQRQQAWQLVNNELYQKWEQEFTKRVQILQASINQLSNGLQLLPQMEILAYFADDNTFSQQYNEFHNTFFKTNHNELLAILPQENPDENFASLYDQISQQLFLIWWSFNKLDPQKSLRMVENSKKDIFENLRKLRTVGLINLWGKLENLDDSNLMLTSLQDDINENVLLRSNLKIEGAYTRKFDFHSVIYKDDAFDDDFAIVYKKDQDRYKITRTSKDWKITPLVPSEIYFQNGKYTNNKWTPLVQQSWNTELANLPKFPKWLPLPQNILDMAKESSEQHKPLPIGEITLDLVKELKNNLIESTDYENKKRLIKDCVNQWYIRSQLYSKVWDYIRENFGIEIHQMMSNPWFNKELFNHIQNSIYEYSAKWYTILKESKVAEQIDELDTPTFESEVKRNTGMSLLIKYCYDYNADEKNKIKIDIKNEANKLESIAWWFPDIINKKDIKNLFPQWNYAKNLLLEWFEFGKWEKMNEIITATKEQTINGLANLVYDTYSRKTTEWLLEGFSELVTGHSSSNNRRTETLNTVWFDTKQESLLNPLTNQDKSIWLYCDIVGIWSGNRSDETMQTMVEIGKQLAMEIPLLFVAGGIAKVWVKAIGRWLTRAWMWIAINWISLAEKTLMLYQKSKAFQVASKITLPILDLWVEWVLFHGTHVALWGIVNGQSMDEIRAELGSLKWYIHSIAYLGVMKAFGKFIQLGQGALGQTIKKLGIWQQSLKKILSWLSIPAEYTTMLGTDWTIGFADSLLEWEDFMGLTLEQVIHTLTVVIGLRLAHQTTNTFTKWEKIIIEKISKDMNTIRWKVEKRKKTIEKKDNQNKQQKKDNENLNQEFKNQISEAEILFNQLPDNHPKKQKYLQDLESIKNQNGQIAESNAYSIYDKIINSNLDRGTWTKPWLQEWTREHLVINKIWDIVWKPIKKLSDAKKTELLQSLREQHISSWLDFIWWNSSKWRSITNILKSFVDEKWNKVFSDNDINIITRDLMDSGLTGLFWKFMDKAAEMLHDMIEEISAKDKEIIEELKSWKTLSIKSIPTWTIRECSIYWNNIQIVEYKQWSKTYSMGKEEFVEYFFGKDRKYYNIKIGSIWGKVETTNPKQNSTKNPLFRQEDYDIDWTVSEKDWFFYLK